MGKVVHQTKEDESNAKSEQGGNVRIHFYFFLNDFYITTQNAVLKHGIY
jgi:hypothetical protein